MIGSRRQVGQMTNRSGGGRKLRLDSPVLILVLLIDAAHEGGGWRQDLVDEDEDGLLRGQLNALPDDVDELADGEIGWYQVLLLVDGRDIALLDLLANDLERERVSDMLRGRGTGTQKGGVLAGAGVSQTPPRGLGWAASPPPATAT